MQPCEPCAELDGVLNLLSRDKLTKCDTCDRLACQDHIFEGHNEDGTFAGYLCAVCFERLEAAGYLEDHDKDN